MPNINVHDILDLHVFQLVRPVNDHSTRLAQVQIVAASRALATCILFYICNFNILRLLRHVSLCGPSSRDRVFAHLFDNLGGLKSHAYGFVEIAQIVHVFVVCHGLIAQIAEVFIWPVVRQYLCIECFNYFFLKLKGEQGSYYMLFIIDLLIIIVVNPDG